MGLLGENINNMDTSIQRAIFLMLFFNETGSGE